MQYGLTHRERDCLSFIKWYREKHDGTSPSYDEIANGIGLAAKSGAYRLVGGLEHKGHLKRLPNTCRSIVLAEQDNA